MADNWYYVQKGNRHGPVALGIIGGMLAKNELKTEDFVWKKGFENWKKIKDVPEFDPKEVEAEPEIEIEAPPLKEAYPYTDRSLSELNIEERVIFIRVGNDRGEPSADYGPFSVHQLKRLFKENRINGKTYLFMPGMHDWKIIADLPEYEDLFNETPPTIPEVERRKSVRKPFVARMVFQNDTKTVYQGLCRDVSAGGMQILINDFKGSAGDKISLNVHPENTEYHFTASGELVRVLDGHSGFSFKFNQLSDEARRAIEKYVQAN